MKDKPLYTLHLVLYDICYDKYVSIHTVLLKGAQLNFSRWLPPVLFDSWLTIINEVFSYSYNNSRDLIIWKNGLKGTFSTKSAYDSITSTDSGQTFSHIWSSKIPHRIKIFMWLVENGVILTKDNMIKRNFLGNPVCFFCSADENIEHLFFTCPVAKVIWGVVGTSIGANNIPSTPSAV